MSVEGFHELLDLPGGETATEVTRGRGIRDPLHTQSVQIHFVVAPQLQVIQAGTTREQVVRDIQHMIRFRVRQVDLQHLQRPIDLLGQSQAADHLVNHPDPAAGDRARPRRYFVMNVGSREDRARILKLRLIQPPLDPLLASSQMLL